MSATWEETAAAIIDGVHRSLPEDADLAARRKACLAARPYEFRVTSWGRKTWASAQRKYLTRFGYVPKNATLGPLVLNALPESPLERAKRRAGAA